MTLWEMNKEVKITYLRPYPKGYFPFSDGVCNNFKSVFLHTGEFINWDLPEPSKVQFNRFYILGSNRFWSCW